jgi:hypothetical protein
LVERVLGKDEVTSSILVNGSIVSPRKTAGMLKNSVAAFALRTQPRNTVFAG